MEAISWKLGELALEEVSDAPGLSCMSFGFDLEPLVRSIEQVGVINPPLLEEGREGEPPVPICGYRRILALKALGRTSCMARFLAAGSIEPKPAFLMNLFDNVATREFNSVEKGMILSRLSLFFREDEILDRFMAILGLPPRTEALYLYLAIDQELDQEMKRALVRKTVGLRALQMLLGLDAGRRKCFFRLFENMTFNANQQTEVIGLVEELSRIQDASPEAILANARIAELVAQGRLNAPQKARALLRTLRKMRFPQLTEAERIFKTRIGRLDLPGGTNISHPPFFEDPNYRMEISFRDGQELMQKLRHLSELPALKCLYNPWETKEEACR
jgi:hypothetical protein